MPGGGQQSQTTRTHLSPYQKNLFNLAMPWLRDFSRNPPELPEGPGVVGFNKQQLQGQQDLLRSIPGMENVVQSAARGNQFLTSGQVLDPSSNRYLAAHMEGATRPIIDNLMENILPTVRGEAATTGNYGSSRQGVAEGISTGKALTQVGDTSARIASDAYGQGLDAMTKGLGLSGQIAQNLGIPGIARSGVGDVRQSQSQRELDDARYREMYPQLLPLMMGQTLFGIGSGLPTGGATTFASQPQSNIFGQLFGGAASLGSLFGGLGSLGQGASGLTALLPFLCDRSQKTNIRLLGRALDGTPLYIFRYVMEPHRDVIGPMADEMPERFVEERNGLKYIKAREWALSMGEENGIDTRANDGPLYAAGAGPYDNGKHDADAAGQHSGAYGVNGNRPAAGATPANGVAAN